MAPALTIPSASPERDVDFITTKKCPLPATIEADAAEIPIHTGIIASPLSWIQDEELQEEIWEVAGKRMGERCGRSGGWMPLFQNSSGIYGISSLPQTALDDLDFEEKVAGNGHVVMLDICSTWPLPNGYQFWNITNSEEHLPPTTSQTLTSSKYPNSTINIGGYPLEPTEELMVSFAKNWHPLSGNFGAMYERSERIVRGALWQKVWEEDGISNGKNTVVTGDAGRVMLPSSG
ncbi:Protein-lysine N-methyltransferase rrg1 [Rhizina undulata]